MPSKTVTAGSEEAELNLGNNDIVQVREIYQLSSKESDRNDPWIFVRQNHPEI